MIIRDNRSVSQRKQRQGRWESPTQTKTLLRPRWDAKALTPLPRRNAANSAAQGCGTASGVQHNLIRILISSQPDLSLRRRSRPQPPSLAQGIAGFVVSLGICPGRMRTGEARAARPPSGFQVLAKGSPGDRAPTEYASLVRRG